MLYIVDRFDRGIAICENSSTREMSVFNKDIFPQDTKEGDAFEIIDGVARKVNYDAVEQRIRRKMERIFKK